MNVDPLKLHVKKANVTVNVFSKGPPKNVTSIGVHTIHRVVEDLVGGLDF